nr:hypothetical protein CFP56_22182 [Quercus suber]
MQGTIKRTPRACERCRQTRRRCLPPYPCRQCVAADVPCEVRDKARPQRRQPLRKTPSIQARDNIVPNVADGLQHHSRTPSGLQSKCSTPCVEQALPRDTFALLKGYVMTCALSEPLSLSKPPLSAIELIDQHIQRPLQPERLWELLMGFQRLIGWQDAKLLDVQELHVTACTYAEHLLDLSPNGVRASAITEQFPLDSVALMFVALALGAIATGELSHGQTLFEISTEVVKHFAGSPSMQLCLAYYLQHMFALRIGTSNYQQGIIAQTVQTAHDLGLHRNTYGVQGLKLFLIVYMADQ